MNRLRCIVSVVLMMLIVAAAAFAQSHGHESEAQAKATGGAAEAQKSFAAIKTLAGEWEGTVKTDLPVAASMDVVPMHVTIRVTSRGNVVVHEFQEANTPLDPSKYDHPVTMLYVDSNELNLVHYCDAGNRPRMIGKMSPDGKKVAFDFADIGGDIKRGHMHQSAFTIVDENHHTEQWTFHLPNGQIVNAQFDLHRVN